MFFRFFLVFIIAGVFISKASMGASSNPIKLALQKAWPEATVVSKEVLLVNNKTLKTLAGKLSGSFKDRILRYYKAESNSVFLGYGVLVSRKMRTKKASMLIAISPLGVLKRVEILAFWEPLEYKPSTSWLKQFQDKTSKDQLMHKQDIDGITGATLSASAMTRAVKNVLLIFKQSLEMK